MNLITRNFSWYSPQITHPRRNWLAHLAVNRNVGGSISSGNALIFLSIPIFLIPIYFRTLHFVVGIRNKIFHSKVNLTSRPNFRWPALMFSLIIFSILWFSCSLWDLTELYSYLFFRVLDLICCVLLLL